MRAFQLFASLLFSRLTHKRPGGWLLEQDYKQNDEQDQR